MLPVSFPVFFICTLISSLPYTLLWAHMGASSRSLLDLLSGRHRGKAGTLWVRLGEEDDMTATHTHVEQSFTSRFNHPTQQEVGVVAGGLLFAILLAFLLRHYTLKVTDSDPDWSMQTHDRR